MLLTSGVVLPSVSAAEFNAKPIDARWAAPQELRVKFDRNLKVNPFPQNRKAGVKLLTSDGREVDLGPNDDFGFLKDTIFIRFLAGQKKEYTGVVFKKGSLVDVNDENIKVVCLYPDGGTSEVQKLQMQTMQGENLKVFGIKGDFDDAQRALKTLLANDKFKSELKKKRLKLSAANSVNFGRILFQIIYHAYAYANLLKQKALKANESFDIIVPSGNFGNALGAYYAKKMGAKIGKIKIASNANNILTQFFTTGVYDLRDKKLVKTISPAMDILISSNVERLLFDKFGSVRTNELMQSLAKNKFYKLSKQELEALKEDFEASWCDDKECETYIAKLAKDGYAIDPHTATCFKMVDAGRINVITSTAHWVKFTPSMIKACQIKDTKDEKDALAKTAKILNDSVPSSINSLFSAKILHKNIIKEDEIEKCVLEWIER